MVRIVYVTGTTTRKRDDLRRTAVCAKPIGELDLNALAFRGGAG
jgi:hypothetical protein